MNAISGDRATVGVLHWDGDQLRFAYSLRLIDSPDISRSVVGIDSRVRECEEYEPAVRGLFPKTLDGIFSVDTRSGDSLVWSPARRGITGDASAHFRELVEHLGLAGHTRSATKLSTPVFRDALADLAADFGEFPGLVHARHEVVGHYTYRSPLSWRNGVWNHTIPLSFDVDTRAELETHVRDALARALTSIPQADRPVLVAAVPSAPIPAVPDAEAELEFIQSQIPGQRARAVRVPHDGTLDLAPLAKAIRRDVLHIVVARH